MYSGKIRRSSAPHTSTRSSGNETRGRTDTDRRSGLSAGGERRRPYGASRLFALCLSALVASALLWSFFSIVDIVATAEGRVIPSARVKRVQPIEAGIVRAVHVKDGDRVKSGQLLVELDPTVRQADRERLANNLLSMRADVARLEALRFPLPQALSEFRPPSELGLNTTQQHREMLISELSEHSADLGLIDNEIDRLRAQMRGFQVGIERLSRVLPLLQERTHARRQLSQQGFGSRLLYLEIEQQLVEQEQEEKLLHVKVEETNAAIEALAQRRSRLEADFRRRVYSRLIEAERLTVSLVQELAKAEQQVNYQSITAPIDGKIQQFIVDTVGGVVTSAQTLMIVVPEDDELEIEALVLNKDIGFIEIGQVASIKFEAFPYTVYGSMPGTIRDVSRDVIEDPRLGFVYPVRVRLQSSSMWIDNRPVPISAGMRATVDVVTEKRRLIEFILSPILRFRDESFRER
jgi:hemolysin D